MALSSAAASLEGLASSALSAATTAFSTLQSQKDVLIAAAGGAAVLWTAQRVVNHFTQKHLYVRSASPKHLFVLVHGLFGSPIHLKYLAKCIAEQDECAAYLAHSNSGMVTNLLTSLDGIDEGGARLAAEIHNVLTRPELQGLESISFVGDGVGGLTARYALGHLVVGNTNTICGLKPGNFVSLATPHLGMREALNTPMKVVASLFPTGRQLLLIDSSDVHSAPLLLRMVEEKGPFTHALSLFRSRITFADMAAGNALWCSTAIAPAAPTSQALVKPMSDVAIDQEVFPHVVASFASTDFEFPAFKSHLHSFSTEHSIIRGLSETPFTRVVVNFTRSWATSHLRWSRQGYDTVHFLLNSVWKSNKKVRLWVDGCFDMMHFGHANAFRQALALGDELVVGVHNDAEITRVKGGPPIMNDEERYEAVSACKWVKEVVRDVPYAFETPEELQAYVDKYNIDYIVHGDDPVYTPDGRDVYEHVKKAGKFKAVKRTEGVSTTDIVGRMLLFSTEHFTQGTPGGVDNSGGSGQRASDVSLEDIEQLERRSNFLPTSRRIQQFSSGRIPGPNDRVVYIDGAFDLFHAGHIRVLKAAKAKGDFLIVGVHGDADINRTRGKNYPIMNLHERVLGVLSCEYVDEVIIGASMSLNQDMIRSMNISVVVHGSLWDFEDYEDMYRIPKELGIYEELESTSDLTARTIVRRVLENRLRYEEKFKKKDAQEQQYYAQKEYVQEQ